MNTKTLSLLSNRNILMLLAFFSLSVLVIFNPALAADNAGSGMPWEDPLQQIMTSITGPVAGVIGLIGVTVAGGLLIFGGELGEFARRLVMLVLVIGLLASAASFLSLLFNGFGAVI